ncbi:MAG: SixA phosphatase family protein [Massilia sp.]
MIRPRVFATLALAGALLVPTLVQAAVNIIYVSRHAEKAAEGKDPVLTTQGQARAAHLAHLLRNTGITQVFSTDTMRTRQTAMVTAAQAGLQVQLYDAGKPALVIEKIKAATAPVLLIGHSNTVPELVKLLGGTATPMGDDEFDRLYQVIIAADGSVTTVLLTSDAQ